MKNGLAFIIQFMKRAAKQILFHWKKHYEKLPWIKNFFSGLRTHNVMVPSPLKITSAKRTNSKYWRILLQKHPTLELLFHQRQDKKMAELLIQQSGDIFSKEREMEQNQNIFSKICKFLQQTIL